jgi:hypothetical protein
MSAIVYGTPKQLPDGRYFLRVNKEDESRVMIQLNGAKLLTKFDESDLVTIELDPASTHKITDVDSQTLVAAKAHCEAWFGKVLSDQRLDAAYIKSMNGPSMNVSKAKVGSKIVTSFFSHTKSAIDPSSVDVGSKCDVILEFSGIWFMQKTFGPVWRVAQVRLSAPPKKLYPDEYLFQDADEVAEEEQDDDYI